MTKLQFCDAGPGEVDWEAMSTVVSTEFLKFAIDSPSLSPTSSAADLQNSSGVEVAMFTMSLCLWVESAGIGW